MFDVIQILPSNFLYNALRFYFMAPHLVASTQNKKYCRSGNALFYSGSKRGIGARACRERSLSGKFKQRERGDRRDALVPLPSASQPIVLYAHVPNSKARQRALNTNQVCQSYFITGFNSCDTKSDTHLCCDFFVLSV